MKRVKIRKGKNKGTTAFIQIVDPNAQAMWGRTKTQKFRDKTKYTRKKKHKGKEDY